MGYYDTRQNIVRNQASQGRVVLAHQLAAQYATFSDVDGVLVTSSTARGHADKYSDLDLIVFWKHAPSSTQRSGVIAALRGDTAGLYPYDDVWCCWSDMFTLGRNAHNAVHSGLSVDVTHYLTGEAVSMMHAVLDNHATDDQLHNLMALVAYGIPLAGESLLAGWQAEIMYPEALAVAMVTRHGQIDYFWRWRSALERGNNWVLVYANFSAFAQRLLRMLLALNRVYFFGFGWLDMILTKIELAPADFALRFRALGQLEPHQLAGELSALIEESYDLVEQHLPGVDIGRLRRIFRFERTFWEQPPTLSPPETG